MSRFLNPLAAVTPLVAFALTWASLASGGCEPPGARRGPRSAMSARASGSGSSFAVRHGETPAGRRHGDPDPRVAPAPRRARPAGREAARGPALSLVHDAASAAAALGQRVRIRGAAANAKLGAVVLRQDLVVYVQGQRAWPDKLVGRRVEVTGELVRTARYRARTSPAGAVSQGTAGAVLLLRRPRWRPVAVPRPVEPSPRMGPDPRSR